MRVLRGSKLAARPRTGERVLLVTGASSGIGRSVAVHAAQAGDHVVLAARGRERLDEVAAECEAAGAASTLVVPTDVGDDAEVAELVSRIVDEHGRLDAVAHCAGVFAVGRVDTMPAEVFDAVVRTDLTGSVNLARHAIRVMRKQEQGSIVLVGSVLGHVAMTTLTPYVVSKWGVRALARQLQLETRDVPDLTISHLAPGPVRTPIWGAGANYSGRPASAAPPADSPDKVAKKILRLLDHPRSSAQVGLVNDVVRLGFTVAPTVYDRVVGPAFSRFVLDRNSLKAPTAGNVLRPVRSLRETLRPR